MLISRSLGSSPSSLSVNAWILKLIIWLTPVLIVIDTVNGALLRGSGASGLSQLAKVGYLVLLAIWSSQRKSGLQVVLACTFTNILFLGVHSIGISSFDVITDDLQWLLRFNILWLGTYFFYSISVSGLIGFSKVFKIFVFVSVVLAINLVLGALGFGYAQYGKNSDADQIGSVGFIFAGNEMSFLIILCQIMVCSHIYFRGRTALYIMVSIIFIFFSVLKATKVAMLGGVLALFIFPGIELILGALSLRLKSWRSVVIAIFALFTVIVSLPFTIDALARTGFLTRFNYFLSEYGLMFTIFSGREEFVRYFLDHVWANYSVLEYMFGPGRSEMGLRMGRQVEIDIFDIAGCFGLIGVFLFFGFFVWMTCIAFRGMIRNKDQFHTSAFILFLFIYMICFTAGHVVYSGLAIAYISLGIGALLGLGKRYSLQKNMERMR